MLTSLIFMHVYLVLCLFAYSLNGKYPCDAEYWIMAVYFPFGIGLFQASNQRLLIYSRKQTNLGAGIFSVKRRHSHIIHLLADLPGKWRAMTWKYDLYFTIGLIVQVSSFLGSWTIRFAKRWLILMPDL